MLEKIKKHGIAGSLRIAWEHLVEGANKGVSYLCQRFPIQENLVVLESEGDLSDNAYALYAHMHEAGYLKNYKVVWLVDHVAEAKRRVFENTECVVKSPRSVKFRRNYALATCRWYIFDHNNKMANLKKRPEQTLTYLSHGWGYKAAKGGGASRERTRPDYLTATGELAAEGLAEYWSEPREKVRITGYPRIDYFYGDHGHARKIAREKWRFDRYRKVIFWMPTFRQSKSAWLSEDYIHNQTGLSIFETLDSLRAFSEFLKENGILLVFKLHHLQAELPVFQETFKNIVILHDEDLYEAGVQLYEIVALADGLISDYSSIAIDFMALDRPIVFTLDDYEQYDKSRGLYPKNAIDFMPGYHVYNVRELEDSVREIADGVDRYKDQRDRVREKYHAYIDGNAAERVLQSLGIRNDRA